MHPAPSLLVCDRQVVRHWSEWSSHSYSSFVLRWLLSRLSSLVLTSPRRISLHLAVMSSSESNRPPPDLQLIAKRPLSLYSSAWEEKVRNFVSPLAHSSCVSQAAKSLRSPLFSLTCNFTLDGLLSVLALYVRNLIIITSEDVSHLLLETQCLPPLHFHPSNTHSSRLFTSASASVSISVIGGRARLAISVCMARFLRNRSAGADLSECFLGDPELC